MCRPLPPEIRQGENEASERSVRRKEGAENERRESDERDVDTEARRTRRWHGGGILRGMMKTAAVGLLVLLAGCASVEESWGPSDRGLSMVDASGRRCVLVVHGGENTYLSTTPAVLNGPPPDRRSRWILRDAITNEKIADGCNYFPLFSELDPLDPRTISFTTVGLDGRRLGREIYALGKDDLRLVRLEDADGMATRNSYALPDWRVGPLFPPEHDEQGWEKILVSGTREEILEALVFLGGAHVSGRAKSDWADLVARVRSRPLVQATLQRLPASDDAWIRDEAALVLRD
jgi:hypothetical protein